MPPQKEKRRSGDIGRGNDLEKLAQKIKKNVGDIPPRWVPGIVAALVAIFAWSAWEPPPPPVLLVEGPVEGDATLYTGYYKLDTKRRVHGSPAWRHATRPDLFLSRDSVGAWKGGTEQGLERDLGFLRLRDRAAVFPSSRSIVDWEWHSGQDGAWVHEPALTCDEAELPQAPTVLLLEGGADLSATDAHGNTPLHAAGRRGHPELFEALLAAGADADACNERGRAPKLLDAADADAACAVS